MINKRLAGQMDRQSRARTNLRTKSKMFGFELINLVALVRLIALSIWYGLETPTREVCLWVPLTTLFVLFVFEGIV